MGAEVLNSLCSLGEKLESKESEKLVELLGVVADEEDMISYMDLIDKLLAATLKLFFESFLPNSHRYMIMSHCYTLSKSPVCVTVSQILPVISSFIFCCRLNKVTSLFI